MRRVMNESLNPYLNLPEPTFLQGIYLLYFSLLGADIENLQRTRFW